MIPISLFLFIQKNYLDTEQLMNRKMRAADGKRIFAIIGLMCVCLVIALVLMLYAFDRDNDQHGETIVFKEIETTKIEQNIQKRHVPDEVIKKSIGVKLDRFKRFKRQLAFNPAYYAEQPVVENLRQKRLSEKLKEIQIKFEHCRNMHPIPSDCEKFHHEMVEVHQALDHEIRMSEFGRYYDNQNYGVDEPNLQNFGKLSDVPDLPGEVPMHELNREDKVLQSVNGFSSFPKFHEELDNRLSNSWNVMPPQNAPELHMPPPIPFERDNEKINPLKAQNFGKKFKLN